MAAATAGSGTGGGGSERALRRRRRPNGRALLGGALVAASTLGVVAAAQAGGSTIEAGRWAVAARPLEPGAVLGPEDVALRPLQLDPALGARAFPSVEELVGSVVLAPVGEGDLLQRSAVAPLEVASVGYEVTLPLGEDRALAERLRPGERVDVLATYAGDGGRTVVVARGAVVVALGQGERSLAGDGATVALSVARADEVPALAHAAEAGALTLVRLPPAGGDPLPERYVPDEEAAS